MQLYTFVHVHSKNVRVFGIWHLGTPYCFGFMKWEMNKYPQMPLRSEVDLDTHPRLQFHIRLL